MKSKLLFVIIAVLLCQLLHAQNVSASFIENEAKIFPNPATTFISVEITQGTSFEVTLTNMLGTEVFRVHENSTYSARIFDISTLPQGYYIAKVTYNNGKVITKRILKK